MSEENETKTKNLRDACDRVSNHKPMSIPAGLNPTRAQGVKDETTLEMETNYPWQFIK